MAIELRLTVNKDTIKHLLNAAGLCVQVSEKETHLGKGLENPIEIHKRARKEAKDWKKVLWKDESKFNLFRNEVRCYTRSPKGNRMDP